MSKSLRVLIVEDSEDDVLMLVRHLGRNGFSPDYEVVETAEDMRAALGKQEWDLVISDYAMPEFDGLSALIVLKESGIDLPFIIVSGEIGEEVAVSAMRAGAHDYVMKGNLARLGPAINRELKEAKERRELKEAEEALGESEERYKSLYVKTPVMLHSVDANGNLVSVSDYWLESLGYELGEVIGRPVKVFLTDESRKDAENKYFPEFFKTGVLKAKELQFVKKNGDVIEVLLSAIAERDAEGEIVRSLAVVVDVTERKRAEEAVYRLRKKNELILDSAGDGIYGLDNEGNTTFINPAAAEILGWEREDLIGKPQHKRIHHTKPDGTPYKREDCPIYAAFKDGKIHTEDDEVFWRKDGTSLPVEYTSTPICDDDDNLVGAVVTFKDITERKKAERDLKNALIQVEDLKDQLQAENIYLQEEIKLEHNFDEIIGASESFKKVLSNVEMVASTDATVLILGETGTGKELIARALHRLSPRKDRALVKVNCAVLPDELVESELFGHEKGAFTSAVARKEGRFELANGGTIFLDEIADLPLDQQAKLLRVLQEGEFERVGGTRTLEVDVRVIAATNSDLEKSVEDGKFREDLFYRLNVFPITVPPLRQRREDIPLLVKHFVKKYGSKFGKEIVDVPRSVMNALQTYHFQGNIRELENIIERAVILAQDKTLRLGENLSSSKSPATSTESEGTLEDVERKYITAVLNESNWRIQGKKGAAPRLGLKPSTLRSRMQKLEITRPRAHGQSDG